MDIHRSPTIYKTYIICIVLLLICYVGAIILRERGLIELKMFNWDPDKISLESLGFRGERFAMPGAINRHTIVWGQQKYLVIFTYSKETKGSGMFIYGSNAFGKTQLKGMLILSNGADETMISKVPNIIQVIDIDRDNNPEFIIDMGMYMDTDFYEQYTIITYDLEKQDLVWNGWIDQDPISGEKIDKGHIVFINGETDRGNMNFEIDIDQHAVKVYQGLVPETEEGEWTWKSVIYELINNEFVFKLME